MNEKSGTSKDAADKLVRSVKRKTRKHYAAEEKIRIVLAGLRGDESIAARVTMPRPVSPSGSMKARTEVTSISVSAWVSKVGDARCRAW